MDYVPYADFDESFGTDIEDEIHKSWKKTFKLIVNTMMMATCNTHNMFNSNEMKEGGQTTANQNVGVMDILS